MRKLLVAALAALALIALALPANAVWKGKACKTFAGPDGSGGVETQVCLYINDHDFQDQIQAFAVLKNTGTKVADFRVQYTNLQNSAGTVRSNGPLVVLLNPGEQYTGGGDWLVHPVGTYWTRQRMWMCWPSIAGDPCGNAVVWNSGVVTYP